MLHRVDENTAALALVEMLGDRNALSFVKHTSRERREYDVDRVRIGRHNISLGRTLSPAIASRRRDLTMPSGMICSLPALPVTPE
jgi:hypothetical protein